MKVSHVQNLDSADTSAVVVVYTRDDDVRGFCRQISSDLALIEDAVSRGEVAGDRYAISLFHGARPLLLVGAGPTREFDSVRYLRAVQAGARYAAHHGYRKVAIALHEGLGSSVATKAAVQGAILAGYDGALLKTGNKEPVELDEVTIVGATVDEAVIHEAAAVAESTNFARDLVNLPPSDLPPTALAEKLQNMASECGLTCSVLDESKLTAIGMGAVLGVAKGSAEPPRVIELVYGDPAEEMVLTLVGKGLTFDSGGLSLKPAAGMEWMKGDMSGAAAVAGAIRAIASLKPAGICVRVLVGAVENMPGPAAMKPGDVLRTFNGKTIEVLNTDAEGRLVLADLLAYAVEKGASHIVDVATLTGAIVIALGNEAAGVIGTPQQWIDAVLAAANDAIERVWQMPLYPEYRRRMSSDIADMKNSGGRPGGALTASAVLAEFVGDIPWAHMDIAGTAWLESKTAYAPTGGTGFGVATLVQLAMSVASGTQSN